MQLVFYPDTVRALQELGLVDGSQAEKLMQLTLNDLRGMGGTLPKDFAGPVTPFVNRRLDLMREKGRDAAIAAYLEKMVKFWREKKKQLPVPGKFLDVWNRLTEEEQFAFMATFYVDAIQAVHDSLFDELVPPDVE